MWNVNIDPYEEVRAIETRIAVNSQISHNVVNRRAIGTTAQDSVTITIESLVAIRYGKFAPADNSVQTVITVPYGSVVSFSGVLLPEQCGLEDLYIDNRTRFYMSGGMWLRNTEDDRYVLEVWDTNSTTLCTFTSEDILDFSCADTAECIYGYSSKEFSAKVRFRKEYMQIAWNLVDNLQNNKCEPYVLIDEQWIPLGVYRGVKISSDDNYSSKTMIGYDTIGTMRDTIYTTGYAPGSRTAADTVTDILTQYNLTYDGDVNTDFTSTDLCPFYYYDVSVRDVLGCCASMNGGLIKTTKDGKLKLVKPSASVTDIPMESAIYMNGYIRHSYSNVSINSLASNGLEYGNASSKALYIENQFMTQDALDSIGATLPLTFMPASLEYRGDPRLEVGDWIRVEYDEGQYYTMPILSHTLSISGGMRGQIESIDVSDIATLTELSSAFEVADYDNHEIEDLVEESVGDHIIRSVGAKDEGYRLDWGSITLTASGTSYVTGNVTFHETFTTTPYVFLSPQTDTRTHAVYHDLVGSSTGGYTGCQVSIWCDTSSASGNRYIRWLAIGKV